MATKAKPAATHKCPEPGCDWSGKTKGSVTQHVKREHAGGDGLAEVRTEYGEFAPRAGGIFNKEKPLRAQPSGVPSVDHAIGIGGLPRGALVEVFGPSKAGKTFVALTFAAYAMNNGGRAGYTDAERALEETFVKLIPGLDGEKLEYGPAKGGEQALNIVKKSILGGNPDVWILDSIPACIPQVMIDNDIGDSAAMAALARLMGVGMPVLEHVVSDTDCTLIMVNHEKTKPGQTFGNPTYTPGGAAPEYYSSVRLRVSFGDRYYLKGQGGKPGPLMGHQVKVKLDKSKVGPPGGTATYDLYYRSGIAGGKNGDGRHHETGIDIGSCWLDVLKTEGRVVKNSGGVIIDTETGERLGSETEVIEGLEDQRNSYVKIAQKMVYPDKYK